MILGIDTSAGQCAVALVDGARDWSRLEPMDRGHAERLFPLIDAVLADAGQTPANLTRVAVCTGPGSFTGLRIGVAAARGLAMGLNIPAIGVSRFQALYRDGMDHVVLPGRGTEVSVQNFNHDGQPMGAPMVEQGAAPDLPVDPIVIARLAADLDPNQLPAPVYLRPADAAPSRDTPPVLLD